MAAITTNHKIDIYNLQNQHRDLEQKLNPTKFGSIFNFNMMLTTLDGSHYHKPKKMTFITHRVNIDTLNKN